MCLVMVAKELRIAPLTYPDVAVHTSLAFMRKSVSFPSCDYFMLIVCVSDAGRSSAVLHLCRLKPQPVALQL